MGTLAQLKARAQVSCDKAGCPAGALPTLRWLYTSVFQGVM